MLLVNQSVDHCLDTYVNLFGDASLALVLPQHTQVYLLLPSNIEYSMHMHAADGWQDSTS
jgi:hypothetical protein